MQTNQTLAHLAAEIAEQREARILAERAAVAWREKYEETHTLLHHVEAANKEYASAVDEQRQEIRELEEQVEQLKTLTAGDGRRELEEAAS